MHTELVLEPIIVEYVPTGHEVHACLVVAPMVDE